MHILEDLTFCFGAVVSKCAGHGVKCLQNAVKSVHQTQNISFILLIWMFYKIKIQNPICKTKSYTQCYASLTLLLSREPNLVSGE